MSAFQDVAIGVTVFSHRHLFNRQDLSAVVAVLGGHRLGVSASGSRGGLDQVPFIEVVGTEYGEVDLLVVQGRVALDLVRIADRSAEHPALLVVGGHHLVPAVGVGYAAQDDGFCFLGLVAGHRQFAADRKLSYDFAAGAGFVPHVELVDPGYKDGRGNTGRCGFRVRGSYDGVRSGRRRSIGGVVVAGQHGGYRQEEQAKSAESHVVGLSRSGQYADQFLVSSEAILAEGLDKDHVNTGNGFAAVIVGAIPANGPAGG